MKPQFKPEEIYLDLSKLSEEQQRKVIALLPPKKRDNQYEIQKVHFILYLDEKKKWWVFGTEIKNKTELTYSQFLDMMGGGEEVLQVENKINIDELSKLCNDYNRNTLKITNLERDLEYKRSWSKESIAIKEIHKEISHAQAIKENAKSKLQDIGIEF